MSAVDGARREGARPEDTLRERTLSVAGADTRLIEAGPSGASEAIVFLHGNPGSSSDWTALAGAAGALGRAVAFDMPGFGRTHVPPGFACDIPAYAGFLEAALAELGIQRAHLVLHDFGGPFGLFWGLQHPDSWASVVLMNVGVMPGYKWHSLAKRWRTPVLGELMHVYIPRAAWRKGMQKNNPKGLPREFVEKMYDEYDRETRRTVLKLYRATPDPGDTARELGEAIAALRKPALVIWGAKDPFIGVEFAQRQRDFFDVQELAILPDSSHWPFQDDPERVSELLLAFLERRFAAAPAGGASRA
jgi:pimeloyl-ACP methyl ester carboxylesterase